LPCDQRWKNVVTPLLGATSVSWCYLNLIITNCIIAITSRGRTSDRFTFCTLKDRFKCNRLLVVSLYNLYINPSKTKRRLFSLNTEFVPRCKHFPSRLHTHTHRSGYVVWDKIRHLFWGKYKNINSVVECKILDC